jgi:hypothetical protein
VGGGEDGCSPSQDAKREEIPMTKLNSLKPGYKKLALRKETLRELTTKELGRIASGSVATNTCGDTSTCTTGVTTSRICSDDTSTCA